MSDNNIRIKNSFWKNGNVVHIFLNRRDGSTEIATCDVDDFFARVAPLPVTWCVLRTPKSSYCYAKDYSGNQQGQSGGGLNIYLHRTVLGLHKSDKRQVDHRDANGLHNTRSNIQVVTPAQNQQRRRLDDRPFQHNRSSRVRNVRRVGDLYRVVVAGRYIGVFRSIELAQKAAANAREKENAVRAKLVFPQQTEAVQ